MGVRHDAERGRRRGLMAADDLDMGTLGSAQARTQRIAPAALAIAMVAGILFALELLRPVHAVDPAARAGVESAITVATLLISSLLIATFDRTRQLRELLLVFAVLALWLADFSYWAGPAVAGVGGPASGGAGRLGCQIIGALALAAAAFVPPTTIAEPFRAVAKAVVALGVGVVAIGTLVAQVIAVHPDTGPANDATAGAAVHSFSVEVQIGAAVILAVAGLAFVARSWRAERGTELLAGTSLLLAAAGVQFVIVPTVPAAWVTPREGARLLAFALLLGGVCLRHARVQRRHAYAAICSERERIARDLHDGLAQDLVCITMEAQRLDCHLGPGHPVMLATRDALAELRGMIADLTASTVPNSEAAVRMVARELGRRLDVEVEVRVEADATSAVDSLNSGRRDELIRATREAIEHAAQSNARHLDVALVRRAGGVVVRVSGAHGMPELRRPGVTASKLRGGGGSAVGRGFAGTASHLNGVRR